ncbi:MAG TPA: hypothetical protein DCL31_06185 [Clostridium sp.]|nr:hypothetical protein [Clostridium sp.]
MVIQKKQLPTLRSFIKEVDSNAFITISTVNDVIGNFV